MTIARQSNLERRRARDQCREKLSQHIHQKLGIEVCPSDVRLNPKRRDPYSWRVLYGKEDFFSQIFSKNLSDHSIGTYRLLIEEVGKTFEAVNTEILSSLSSLTPLSPPEGSFTTLIDHLKLSNEDLSIQLHEKTTELDIVSKRRQILEEENQRYKDNQRCLEEQLQDRTNLVVHLQGVVSSLFAMADKALPELEEIRQRVYAPV
ncbi:hypothetical protein V8C42DRAFT_356148 [Trichoderma barbatum]